MNDRDIRKKQDKITAIQEKLSKALKWESRLGGLDKTPGKGIFEIGKEMKRYTEETSTELRGKLQEAYKDLQDAHAFMTKKRK